MQNLTNQTSMLAYSRTMTALIVITHTTCSRSLREPHPVMLCQSAADLSSIHGARHPPAIAFNCGDVHAWSGSIGGTVIT